MADHKLKTWPDSFEAIRSGRKTHEWRRNDRGFAVGDRLVLEEFYPCRECGGSGRVRSNDGREGEDCGCAAPHGTFTGHSIKAWVTFVTRSREFGVPDGYVVMSVTTKEPQEPLRDPRIDPEPGDCVAGGADDKMAWVLEILREQRDCDPELGPAPHVVARVDSHYGQRRRSVMSLETWRKSFATATPVVPAPRESGQ